MTTRFSLSLLLGLLLLPVAGNAQSLLLDNFNSPATTALSDANWTVVSGGTTNPILVATPGLTLPKYPGASGNAASFTTTGQDVSRDLTAPVTAGSVYVAALVNLSAAKSGDYFLHGALAGGASPFGGRVFAKSSGTGFQLGVSKATSTAAYGAPVYSFGTTYLIVLKYTFNGGTATDDLSDLYVFAAGDDYSAEPATPLASSTDGTDVASVGAVNLRQGTASNAPTGTIDGIRVGSSWNDAVLATQTVDDGAGYRLLGAPVQGVTVGTLAGINLVQSVVGQYPTFPNDNLFLSYSGSGATAGYVAATDVANAVTPGKGFFWYLFDQAITPDPASYGGGTSRSYTLPERPLFASGTVNTADVAVGFPLVTDGFYMIANPFAQTMLASGITQAGGTTFSNFLQAYDAATGFVLVDRTTAVEVSMWQGFFAELTGGTAPTFTFDAASRTDGLTPLVSRSATQQVAIHLDGTTDAGVAVHDRAAIIRIDASASAGWDAGDASKLIPPTEAYALVAPVGVRDGAAHRQAVLSLPAATDVTLAFTATHAGTYTLTAEMMNLPDGATVRDLVSGRVASLADGLPFTSAATGWTERFVVSFGRPTAGEQAPTGFALGALYPNPAAGRAAIELRVDAPQTVRATVVDALGRTVATVFEGALSAGQSQTLSVETAGLAPGVYAVRVQGATFTETRRLVVAR